MNSLDIILKYKELQDSFSYILKNNTSNNLPYHNLNHLLCVVKYCYNASVYYNLPEKEEKELLLAALFHDVNHSGGKEKDSVNVKNAIDIFSKFFNLNLKYSNCDIYEIINIIKATEYPYVIEPVNMSLRELIIRDADLMQVGEYNWIQQNMLGLSQEMNITLDKMIAGQTIFLTNSSFNTKWGAEWKRLNWETIISNLNKLSILYHE